MTRRLTVCLMAAAAVAVLGGCRTRTAPAPAVPTATAATPGAPAPPDAIREFGYIDSIKATAKARDVTIAYAEMLRGDAARRAAEADGAIPEGGDLDSDYYIRDLEDQTGMFHGADDTEVWLVDGPDAAPTRITFQQLEDAIGGKNAALAHLQDAPFWFTLADDRIVKIEQQYVP